jgi:hypothetical protein
MYEDIKTLEDKIWGWNLKIWGNSGRQADVKLNSAAQNWISGPSCILPNGYSYLNRGLEPRSHTAISKFNENYEQTTLTK